MRYLAWSYVLVCLALVLVEPVQDFYRHRAWKRAWKRDSMSTYRHYLAELERAHQTEPKQCRTKRREARR